MNKMNIKAGLGNIMFFIVITIVIITAFSLFINNDLITSLELPMVAKLTNDNIEELTNDNIEELHWENMPITYSFSEDCVGQIVPRVEWAFDIITNATNNSVYFKEVENYANINFLCYSGQNINDEIITYGLANTTWEENIITEATIEFWSVSENTRPNACQYFPNLELHEILHTFGFDHIENNRYNIMYPYIQDCLKEIEKKWIKTIDGKSFYPADDFDKEQVDCMNYIYSNGEINGSCTGLMYE